VLRRFVIFAPCHGRSVNVAAAAADDELLLDLNIETRRASWWEKIITTLANALRASREVLLEEAWRSLRDRSAHYHIGVSARETRHGCVWLRESYFRRRSV
jgi:hypothetical protein